MTQMFAIFLRRTRLLCYNANEKRPIAGNQCGKCRGGDGRAARRSPTHRIVRQHARGRHDAGPGTLETCAQTRAVADFFHGAATERKFLYSPAEFSAMLHDVDVAKSSCMDGVVLGLLDAEGKIDTFRTKMLVARARPLPVTFHRAFDECADLHSALEDVIQTGATRLLTSGGKRTAPEALETLGGLVRMAGERLIVMPGSGLHAWNIQDAIRKTGAREFHAGLSSLVPAPAENLLAFEQAVAQLSAALRDCD